MALRFIQAGLGGWGYSWARDVLMKNEQVELVACVDISEEILQRVRTELGIQQTFTSLEEALDTVETDAVLITSPLPAHAPLALTALRAGKHVLLEKPFAATIEEARHLVEVAEQQNVILAISQNYRFYPAVQAVRKLIQNNTLGPVASVNLDFRRYDNTAPVETYRHYHIWQPLLVDMSIHHFDLMRYVLGQEPTQISCTTWSPSWSRYKEDPAGAATISFTGGAVVSYRGNWVSTGPETPWAGEWHMECEQGEIVWTSRGAGPEDERVTVRPRGKRPYGLRLPEVPKQDRHGSLTSFIQAVQTGEEPSISGRNNLPTLALMFASVEAATSGKPVTFEQQSTTISQQ
uniref:Dehydrogenase n=1 Tax=Thermosporothrix sp. COM3 TaxID=2490863 RepID=A0A455SFT0_9CHLR|nr:dehydrogenase [Thermosporothrix sp. COM3]